MKPTLVVSRNDTWYQTIARELSKHGLEHVLASDRDQGLRLMEQLLPGVIVIRLTDLAPLDLDGLKTMRAVHPLARTIVVTEDASLSHLLDVVEAGAADVFVESEPCAFIVAAIVSAQQTIARWLLARAGTKASRKVATALT